MALKAIIESLDSVEEQFHVLYEEQDGKFVLQIEGIEAHPGAQSLKAALDRVRTEKRTLSEKLTTAEGKLADLPEDFDAEEWIRLKAEAPDPADPEKKKPSDEHLQSQKRLYEQRIANLEKKHTEEMKAKDGEIVERDSVIESVLVEDGLTKALVESGVAKEYLRAARALLKPSVKVVRDDDGTRRAVVETDLGEDEIGKYVANWSQSDEGRVFVAKATGGDATGSNARILGDNPWDNSNGKKPNLTKQQELISANPEKARQLAKAAGAAPNW